MSNPPFTNGAGEVLSAMPGWGAWGCGESKRTMEGSSLFPSSTPDRDLQEFGDFFKKRRRKRLALHKEMEESTLSKQENVYSG